MNGFKKIGNKNRLDFSRDIIKNNKKKEEEKSKNK